MVYRVITVEDYGHRVSRTDEGTWYARATVFFLERFVGDLNKVIFTGGVWLLIKTIEGEQDLFICGDLQVPGLMR